tara:strand:+ start:7422 stop:7652 length:231 start_codon:yes stop_codon:yes gene_type:complete
MTENPTQKDLLIAIKVISALGGVKALAAELNKAQPSISHWKVRGLPDSYSTRKKLVALANKKLVNPQPLVAEIWDG